MLGGVRTAKLVGHAPSADRVDTFASNLPDQASLADFVRLLREVDAEEAASGQEAVED